MVRLVSYSLIFNYWGSTAVVLLVFFHFRISTICLINNCFGNISKYTTMTFIFKMVKQMFLHTWFILCIFPIVAFGFPHILFTTTPTCEKIDQTVIITVDPMVYLKTFTWCSGRKCVSFFSIQANVTPWFTTILKFRFNRVTTYFPSTSEWHSRPWSKNSFGFLVYIKHVKFPMYYRGQFFKQWMVEDGTFFLFNNCFKLTPFNKLFLHV